MSGDIVEQLRARCAGGGTTRQLIRQAADEIELLREALADATDVIEGVVVQACTDDEGDLDSVSHTCYATGIRWLAARGRVTIESDHGRRVIARWTP